MTSKLPAWQLYLLGAIGIVGSWLVSILTPSGADFSTLLQTGPLKALVILGVTWLVACAAHAKATGDWTPVSGVVTELKSAPAIATEQHVSYLAELVHDLAMRLDALAEAISHPQPEQPPIPPPPPSLEAFHRPEAGLAELPPMPLQRVASG